ncbi:MAG: hypothetical protein FJW23_01915 [Acidimicrobiia bacterium]|nr:hypothetical protein [Acidimicrobiia bacterium]
MIGMRSTLISLGAGLVLVAFTSVALYGLAAQRGQAPAAAVKPAPPGPLPPIPYDGYPAPRPMPMVQATYEFAARHPEVLSHMPCFCGCDRSANHGSNHDCFIKRRGADGRILEWDSHGYGCAICIDVARDAMQMHNAGASVVAIRNAIDAKYGPRFPGVNMPTPKPTAANR